MGWLTVIAQFFLMLGNRSASIAESIARFFSYFTILTNIIVALYFTIQLTVESRRRRRAFGILNNLTAITVYITVVGLVYQVALRHTWHPTGFQMVVDEMLHTVIPLAVIFYWHTYERVSKLKWEAIPKALIYPLAYLIFVLWRGGVSRFYPYPFIDVQKLGWDQTFKNISALFGLFLFLFVGFIGFGKFTKSR